MSKPEKLPVWDLSALYKSVDDPKIEKDAKKNLTETEKFVRTYRGKVAKLSAKEFLGALKSLENISLVTTKLNSYPSLLMSVDNENPKVNVLFQQMTDHSAKIQGMLIFFDLEIIELDISKILKFIQDPIFADHKHYLKNIAKLKPHHLSEKEEQIFNDKSVTSFGAFSRLFEQHFASKKFNGLTISDVTKQMLSPERTKRKTAAEALTTGLKEDARMLTLIFNTVIKDKAINDRWHNFQTPEQGRHLSNEVDQKMVDTMVEVISSNYGIVEDFYNFKRSVFKFPKLYAYDRYAPIAKTEKKYTFEEAKKIILVAFSGFSKEFAKIASDFFDKNWIHAPIMTGKRGGAFCAGIAPDTHPYILINYLGNHDDVQTLAHELGHGINDVFMQKLNYFNYGVSLPMAETASVFCEMIVFDYLKARVKDDKEKFAMYMGKIQEIFATVFRQTSMHKFEQDIHKLQKERGEITEEEFNHLWDKRQKEMFGNSVDLTGSENWWSYIPHLVIWPFYVYAYSFGELLVLSLYAQYKQDPVTFVPKYLEMMSAGSSKSPQEILEPFGIDLADRKFWQGGINIIKELVTEAEQIYKDHK